LWEELGEMVGKSWDSWVTMCREEEVEQVANLGINVGRRAMWGGYKVVGVSWVNLGGESWV
jgi:hypothetical protein